MSATAEIREWYTARFERFEKGLNGASKTPLHALRRSAMESFRKHGFPTTADEEWRFTSVAPIASTRFQPVLAPTAGGKNPLPLSPVLEGGGIVLVFVNGQYAESMSVLAGLPPGVAAGSLAAAIETDPGLALRLRPMDGGGARDAFGTLNTAFLTDGAYIRVNDGVEIAGPVHILSFAVTDKAEQLLIQPRHVIVAGKNSRLSVVETYAGSGSGVYLTNAVTEIAVGEGGTVEHDTLQTEASESYHVGTTLIALGAGASFTSNAITLGGAIVRNNVLARFEGERAECTLNGLSVATGTQLVDNHTVIDHAVPRCESHELYKSVLDGSARGVFNGKIFVRPDAQKTDAKQTNKTLLLSDEATIDTKPQLEIFADDVKCTHGATVGQLDEEQVFYLRARGIGEAEARDLLTFAFATDVINRVHVGALRERLDTLLHARLRQGRVNAES